MTDAEIDMLRIDQCPDCKSMAGLVGGPRGGAGRNIFCDECGAGFNVAQPRFIMFAERISARRSAS
jgi:hypothetical protein